MRNLILGGKKATALTLGLDKMDFSKEDVFSNLMDAYFTMGGNSLDTAHVYAKGESEQLVGNYLEKHRMREDVFLATKIGFPDTEDNWRSRLSMTELEEDLAISLERLKTNSVDLLWLHRDDESIPVSEILLRMNRLAEQGKCTAIGASNFRAARMAEANAFAKEHHLLPFVASQIQWSAMVSSEEVYLDHGIVIMNAEEYAAYEKLGIPVFCYAPLAGGYANKLLEGREMTEKLKSRFDSIENRERAKRLAEEAKILGVSLAAATLSYLAHNRLETAVVTGAKTPEDLKASFEAFERVALTKYGFPY